MSKRTTPKFKRLGILIAVLASGLVACDGAEVAEFPAPADVPAIQPIAESLGGPVEEEGLCIGLRGVECDAALGIDSIWWPFDGDPVTVGPDDFVIELIVLENKCFGSAGATVTVEPDLFSDVTGNYTIIYEVRGGEAAETFNLELTDDDMYSYDEHRISTSSCTYDLSAEVVRVLDR